MKREVQEKILLGIFLVVLAWSLIRPDDYFIWFLEALPALIAAGALILLRNKHRFSVRTYAWIVFGCCLLFVGAHYTYEKNPLFNWFQILFGLDRNYYDRFGHLFQGFIPAIVLRELITKKNGMKKKWMTIGVFGICLSISAIYELIEWWVALLYGTRADLFLGFQGDVWDAQWDMMMAAVGALLALIFTSQAKELSKK